jgi:hypothetical protein
MSDGRANDRLLQHFLSAQRRRRRRQLRETMADRLNALDKQGQVAPGIFSSDLHRQA